MWRRERSGDGSVYGGCEGEVGSGGKVPHQCCRAMLSCAWLYDRF